MFKCLVVLVYWPMDIIKAPNLEYIEFLIFPHHFHDSLSVDFRDVQKNQDTEWSSCRSVCTENCILFICVS